MSSILARPMGIVFFRVVIDPPRSVCLLDLRPGARFSEGKSANLICIENKVSA
jgi:hypothetical protein